jgi:MFS family permease
MTYSSVLSFLSLFVIEQGMDSGNIFAFFIVLAITSLISRPLSGKMIDTKGSVGYDISVLIGAIATIVALLFLAQTTTLFHLVAGGIFYGIGFGFTQPTMLALSINSVSTNKRGGANATYWTAFDMGVASGSVVWGLVASTFGYSLIFKLSVIPALAAIAIYFAGKKFYQKAEPATSTAG